MDSVLAEDVHARLRDCAPGRSVDIIIPKKTGGKITPKDIEDLAPDTVNSKILIFDVRFQTRAELMSAYSSIIRRNRADFNLYCYSVLISDSPPNLFTPGNAEEAFRGYLANLRIDFSPAVCFVDPFISHSFDEIQTMAMFHNNSLPQELPERLKKHFKGKQKTVQQLRSYFRAGGNSRDMKRKKKKKRQEDLKGFYRKRIQKNFPEMQEQLLNGLTKQGCHLAGEALGFNIYPFFFEEWLEGLIRGTGFSGITEQTGT